MSHNSRSNLKRKRGNNAASAGNRTLGMVWGANSTASSKNSSGKNGGASFKDFGSYMSEKNRKLRLQFQSQAKNTLLNDNNTEFTSISGNASCSNNSNGLFNGICIFVDGFTIPSNQELRNYMIQYGGRFENYFSRERVTHIICSNLPNSKIKNLRSFSRGLPVVKPQWIVDSIAANKILHVAPYQLECLANECPLQQRLSAFFLHKHDSLTDKEFGTETKLGSTSSGEESVLNGGLPKNRKDFVSNPQAEIQANQTVLKHAQNVLTHGENWKEENIQILDSECQMPCSSSINKFDQNRHGDACSENEMLEHDIFKSANTEDICNPVGMACTEAMDLRPSTTKQRLHSTLEDANFVENYFKNSRLHFIGTWRNRYRKRFAGKYNEGIQCPYSGVDTISRTTSHAYNRVIIHIDMDCFFVSVVIRNRPELDGKPVAVCHSDNPHGTAEISSANYPARGYGIKAGIFVRDAKALCPHLVVLPYDFSAYEEVADQFYDVLHKHCNCVQALSCDEAYLDVTGLDHPDYIASAIRQEVFDITKCTASAGIARNLLMARMATKRAKPNGQFHIRAEEVEQFLEYLPIKELPGVGPALQEKLNNQNVHNCSQLRRVSKEMLQRDFGSKTGDMLWHYCRGIDNRQVQSAQEHKSIGAEVNWGVRFDSLEDVHHFLMNLSKEVSLRLQGASMRGRTVTLKVKKRKKGAGEPTKFMGCGSCDNISHSVTVPYATDSIDVLLRISRQLFTSFHLDVREVRGIGMQVSRLEAADSCNQDKGKNVLKSWLASMSNMPNSSESVPISNKADQVAEKSSDGEHIRGNNASRGSRQGLQSAEIYQCKDRLKGKTREGDPLPHISQLDPTVLANLPPEILSEMNEFYNIKVFDCISGSEKGSESHNMLNINVANMISTCMGNRSQQLNICMLEENDRKDVENGLKNMKQNTELKDNEEQALDVDQAACTVDLPPQSQLDPTVLLALPLSLRLEIEQLYNATNAPIKQKSPVNLRRKKTSSQCQLPMSNLGKDIQKRSIDKVSASNSHTYDSMNMTDGNIEREGSKDDTISLSMSQVDINILQELPIDIQRDVLDSLPAHRPPKVPCENAESCDREKSEILNIEHMEEHENAGSKGGTDDTLCDKCLWKGNPPEWVKAFKRSNCVLIQLMSECYSRADSAKCLSSLLLYLVSSLPQEFVAYTGIQEKSVMKCAELFRQYIEERVKYDLEEIYICVRLLKRLVVKSYFWLTVYNTILPALQASVGESYGGNLKL